MSSKHALLAAGLCIGLASCNTARSHIGDVDPLLGEAVKYNAAIQTIDPDPVYAEDAAQPGSRAVKATEALKRYRTDKVNDRHHREVQQARSGAMSTTSSSGGGSGPQ